MADLTEKPAPSNYRTEARSNAFGKSQSNAAPTPANKRGTTAAMTMKDSLGRAKMTPETEIR